MASLMNFRVDDDLKDRFAQAAEAKHQTQSEAMREALLLYIRRVRNEQLRDAAQRIRRHDADEDDVMGWSEANRAVLDD